MASAAVLLCVFLTGVGVSLSAAEVYKVGGSVGWTILGSPNYTAWAANHTFHVGDVLLFQYNNQFHNVEQTSKADYTACNAASPLSVHKSGNDSIPINATGSLYFLCGIPGHCSLGQKVEILIATPAPPTAAPSPSGTPAPPTAAPSPSGTPAPPTAAPSPPGMPSPGPAGGSGGGGSSNVPTPAPKPNQAPATRTELAFALAALIGVAAISSLVMA